MSDTQPPSGGLPPVVLTREDLVLRRHNGDTVIRGASLHMADTELRHRTGRLAELPRDDQGRTPREAYFFWCGVVEAYDAMLALLTEREGRLLYEREARS